jgi:hypothetical protein
MEWTPLLLPRIDRSLNGMDTSSASRDRQVIKWPPNPWSGQVLKGTFLVTGVVSPLMGHFSSLVRPLNGYLPPPPPRGGPVIK